MEGWLTDVSRDYATGKMKVTFLLDGELNIEEFFEKLLTIIIKPFRKKRSLDANAYFHVLVGKIAEKMNISAQECKNLMLGRYGQVEEIDGEPMVFITSAPPEYMMKYEELHTRYIDNNTYLIIRGSHTYDTAEMSTLINGTVDEAKELGIETMTPDELERLKSLWKA